MRRDTIILLLATVPLLLAPSCPTTRFEVVMEPTTDGHVKRTFTVWRSVDDNARASTQPTDVVPDKWLALLRQAYHEPQQADDGKWRFSGPVTGRLPADMEFGGLENFGHVHTSRSPMGTTIDYAERMPGRTDMLEVIRAATESVDLMIRAYEAYADGIPEIAEDPAARTAVSRFLHEDLRPDLLNAAIIGWLEIAAAGESDKTLAEKLTVREGLFLEERGYLADTSYPPWGLSEEAVIQGVLHKLAIRLGHKAGEPLPSYLAHLDVDEALKKGLEKLGISEEEYWKGIEPIYPAGMFGFVTGSVVWKMPVRPRVTNGEWNEADHELHWEAKPKSGCELSQVLYAFWSLPDEAYQHRHFGRVVLDEKLVEYNAWWRSCDAAQQAQWAGVIKKLTPESNIESRLRAFRFSSSNTTRPAGDSSPTYGAKLILEEMAKPTKPAGHGTPTGD